MIPWLVDGCIRSDRGRNHVIELDWKGQDTVVGDLQARKGRHCYYLNPRRHRRMPSHRINPLAHLHRSSSTSIPDALLSSASWIPETDHRAAYFQRNAQKSVTAAQVTMARTDGVVQSTRQLGNLKPGASEVIPNSCGTQIYLGTRSVQQASLIQRQLGRVTLEYTDRAQIERALAAKKRALAGMMFAGSDPIMAMMEASHHERIARQKTKMARDLRGIDEILGEPNGRDYVFMPGVLKNPANLTVKPYWQRRDLAGTYLGDPFHSRPGTVEIATFFGQRHRKVITEPAPMKYRDWP